MDFIAFFPCEISDEILSYLSESDILNASLVSKHWYNHIAQSNDCMSKITLYYYGELNKDINPVLKSSRRYQNVIFICDDKEFSRKRRIENIFRLILNKFSDSITRLITSHDTKRVSLPKLIAFAIKLELPQRAVIHSNGILSTTKVIESLFVSCLLDFKSLKIMEQFLQNMTELKALNGAFETFINNWKSWFNRQFNLKYAACTSQTLAGEFLLQHRSTLEIFDLCSTDNLEFVMSNFPCLHTIYIDTLGTNITQEYPLNETVTTLVIMNSPEQHHDSSIMRILSKFRNLKCLEVNSLDLGLFAVILELCTLRSSSSLKYLYYADIPEPDEMTEVIITGLNILRHYMTIGRLEN